MKDIIKKVLISQEEIEKRCKELGDQINSDYKGKTPILISLLKGAVPFCAQLLKNINIDCQIDFMDVSSYSGGLTSTGQIKIIKDLDYSIEGRDVIIVEDIIDTGLTLKTIGEMLGHRNPKSLEICCLLDKHVKRTAEVNVKYTGFKIENEFVIGFGLDYDELYRNLPYIAVVDTTKL